MGLGIWAISDREPVVNTVSGHNKGTLRDGPAPSIRAAIHAQGDSRQRHGRYGGTEVTPASVKAFGEADVLGLEPQRRHVNTHHEAGTNRTQY